MRKKWAEFEISRFVGRSVQSVELSEPSLWLFNFGPGVIGAECPWRLLQSGVVTLGSEDHLQPYGLPSPIDAAQAAGETLRSRMVTSVEIADGTADLSLKFEGDLELQLIPISSGYESWYVTTPSGAQIFAQAGGKLRSSGGYASNPGSEQ